MLRWLISWGQCRRCHWSPQPSCVLQVLQVLLALWHKLWLPETAKQRQRAAVSVVQGHGQTGGKFQPDLQNQMKIYRTNMSERERKKEYSVLERVMAKLVGGCVWQELSHYLVTPLLLRRCHYLVRFSIKIKLPTFRLESILHKWI